MLAKILSRYWWMVLLRAVVAILFGVLLFARPGISLASLVLLFGAFALVDGIGNVITALSGRAEHETWWVLLLGGLAGIGVGVLTFMNPGATALALLFFIAVWAIATGLLQIVAAVRLRKEIQGEFWLGLGGLASVVFGCLLLSRPGAGALAVLWLIGAYAITSGVILLILALAARGWVKQIQGPATA